MTRKRSARIRHRRQEGALHIIAGIVTILVVCALSGIAASMMDSDVGLVRNIGGGFLAGVGVIVGIVLLLVVIIIAMISGGGKGGGGGYSGDY